MVMEAAMVKLVSHGFAYTVLYPGTIYTNKATMMVSQAPTETAEVINAKTNKKKMEEAAREILKYCNVTDVTTVDDIIKKLMNILNVIITDSGSKLDLSLHC